MAHLHIVLNLTDADPTTQDPEATADEVLHWDSGRLAAPGADVAGARWPLTRDQIREAIATLPDPYTTGQLLDAVEALLNPPWES